MIIMRYCTYIVIYVSEMETTHKSLWLTIIIILTLKVIEFPSPAFIYIFILVSYRNSMWWLLRYHLIIFVVYLFKALHFVNCNMY